MVLAGDDTVVLTVPLPGAPPDHEDDDCEVCRALREGRNEEALELLRTSPNRIELPDIDWDLVDPDIPPDDPRWLDMMVAATRGWRH